MKHGPIALIDEEMPVVFIATQNSLYEKVVSNMQEVKARKGRIIAIVNKGDHKLQELADYYIEVPATVDSLEPLITSIPLQLLAYHIVTVDEAGRVTKTAIDRANSTTTDDCLLENSLLYAQKAKFNAVSGKKEQIGTITYIFQSKR